MFIHFNFLKKLSLMFSLFQEHKIALLIIVLLFICIALYFTFFVSGTNIEPELPEEIESFSNNNMSFHPINLESQDERTTLDNIDNDGNNNNNNNSETMVLNQSSSLSTLPDIPSRQTMNPSELLPNDKEMNAWLATNPSVDNKLDNQNNLIDSKQFIGIQTKGQSNKNPEMSFRASIPIPKKDVSPWMQSTIEPDLTRRGFEINGGC